MRTPALRTSFGVAMLAIAGAGWAQAQLAGPGQFPQFRGLSGLPGGGLPIANDGSFGRGAWAHSTPIAYVPRAWRVGAATSLLNGSRNLSFEFERGGNAPDANWTGSFLMGVPLTPQFEGAFALTFLSSYLDNVQSAQVRWRTPGPVAYAVGVQDIGGQGGTQGMDNNRNDPGESRSWYGVATYEGTNWYATAGFGDTRFRGRPFGSVSAWRGDWTAMAEWDTFGANWSVGYAFDVAERPCFASVGLVKGRYAFWSLGIAF
ncbi:MAG TPA: hypothetical protein PLB31_08315 [Fimbriimonadaceae bacterium]|nr:hypothetical protein [Armatimonadota bacterium]HRD30465.1 hypothetical protein [Fimbriimonadaceae bacterium]HRE92875.1 hypothetical protein [Fimbriimonadaceae bacterium]HRI74460.1 hypothetical protein [Fimbriimonadaceae bacterium]